MAAEPEENKNGAAGGVMSEDWLSVVGFEGVYEGSNLGRVRSLDRMVKRGSGSMAISGRVMSPSEAGKGYRKVALCSSERQVHRYVHEMVLEAFVSPRPLGQESAHGNGKRDDNRLENLRWDTRSGNHADKRAHGTLCQGETHGRRKLSLSDVLKIRSSNGSCKEIGQQFGVCPMQISRIKTGKNWKAS